MAGGIGKCAACFILTWGIIFFSAPFNPLSWPVVAACCIVLCNCCGGQAKSYGIAKCGFIYGAVVSFIGFFALIIGGIALRQVCLVVMQAMADSAYVEICAPVQGWVVCPDQPSDHYCDCSGNCFDQTNTFCGCPEAVSCCSSAGMHTEHGSGEHDYDYDHDGDHDDHDNHDHRMLLTMAGGRQLASLAPILTGVVPLLLGSATDWSQIVKMYAPMALKVVKSNERALKLAAWFSPSTAQSLATIFPAKPASHQRSLQQAETPHDEDTPPFPPGYNPEAWCSVSPADFYPIDQCANRAPEAYARQANWMDEATALDTTCVLCVLMDILSSIFFLVAFVGELPVFIAAVIAGCCSKPPVDDGAKGFSNVQMTTSSAPPA